MASGFSGLLHIVRCNWYTTRTFEFRNRNMADDVEELIVQSKDVIGAKYCKSKLEGCTSIVLAMAGTLYEGLRDTTT